MKQLNQFNSDNIGDVLLYGVVMFANIDYIGIADYAIKAVIGGAAWFIFKIAGDYYAHKMKGGSKISDMTTHNESEGGI